MDELFKLVLSIELKILWIKALCEAEIRLERSRVYINMSDSTVVFELPAASSYGCCRLRRNTLSLVKSWRDLTLTLKAHPSVGCASEM